MNHAWTTSIPVLTATGMGIQQFGLDQLSRILLIVYCFLGSLAALKYLLQGGRYSARRKFLSREPARKTKSGFRLPFHPSLRKKREIPVPRQQPEEPEIPCPPIPDLPAVPVPAFDPPVPQPVRSAAAERADLVSELPSYPSRSEVKGIYEVENPGFTRSSDYGLRLKRAADGVMLSCELDQELVCVFLRKGLTEVGINLQRQGLQEVFDLLDAAGQPLEGYPAGRLRLVNAVPAICKDLGTSLQLVEKGQIKVFIKD